MKINRAKLNAILRSGLHPEITTRKQLAAHLKLDPTSLTRWFATSDRVGNPRYPVVPDRHVTAILQTFSLEAGSLNLPDEEFRRYCFDKAVQLSRAREQSTSSDRENSNALEQSKPRSMQRFFLVLLLCSVGVTAGLVVKKFSGEDASRSGDNNLEAVIADKAQAALDKGLEQLRQGRYPSALGYFDEAAAQVAILPAGYSRLREAVTRHYGLALYGKGPWHAARRYFETGTQAFTAAADKPAVLLAGSVNIHASADTDADVQRATAQAEMEWGRNYLAYSYIETAIDRDSRALGTSHPAMASNWLVLSHILSQDDRLDEAKIYARKAMDLDRQLFGEDHPRVAEIRMTLSMIAIQQDDLDTALTLYRDAYNSFAAAGLQFDARRPETEILVSLGLMTALSENPVAGNKAADLRQSLENLQTELNANIPFITRRYAGLLWRDAVRRGLL